MGSERLYPNDEVNVEGFIQKFYQTLRVARELCFDKYFHQIPPVGKLSTITDENKVFHHQDANGFFGGTLIG